MASSLPWLCIGLIGGVWLPNRAQAQSWDAPFKALLARRPEPPRGLQSSGGTRAHLQNQNKTLRDFEQSDATRSTCIGKFICSNILDKSKCEYGHTAENDDCTRPCYGERRDPCKCLNKSEASEGSKGKNMAGVICSVIFIVLGIGLGILHYFKNVAMFGRRLSALANKPCNDGGRPIYTDPNGKVYCMERIGEGDLPCGPLNQPQCNSCKRFQMKRDMEAPPQPEILGVNAPGLPPMTTLANGDAPPDFLAGCDDGRNKNNLDNLNETDRRLATAGSDIGEIAKKNPCKYNLFKMILPLAVITIFIVMMTQENWLEDYWKFVGVMIPLSIIISMLLAVLFRVIRKGRRGLPEDPRDVCRLAFETLCFSLPLAGIIGLVWSLTRLDDPTGGYWIRCGEIEVLETPGVRNPR